VAARRLIVVLAVLFAISIAAAAIAPDRRSPVPGGEESTEETTEEAAPAAPPPLPSGELLTETITADAADPQTIRAEPGDQLQLSVEANRPLQIEIEPFGLLEEATPDAPASFDILLREAGQAAITDAESGEIVGRILSEPEPAAQPPGSENGGKDQRPGPGANATPAESV